MIPPVEVTKGRVVMAQSKELRNEKLQTSPFRFASAEMTIHQPEAQEATLC
jgi:hypothetical protein